MKSDRYLGHMSLSHLIKYGLSLPPHIALAKVFDLTKRRLRGNWLELTEKHRTTFVESVPVKQSDLARLTGISPASLPVTLTSPNRVSCEKTIAQEFDLLGSGWTNVCITGSGAVNPVTVGNRERASQIRNLISPEYKAIDWHSDFKSGYRWSAAVRAESIAYGHEPGVDIKVPWELARLQHLPQLALAYGSAVNNNKENPKRYLQVFCDQALDFISANPPGYGVNWSCTMDVAIRAANLAMAFDLFRSFDADIAEEFTAELVASLIAHGTHITQNLEWHDGFRGNHYLADIVGLLVIAALLPADETTDSWLAFAIREFVEETHLQFHTDGTNAEASTNYHRLSAEMVVYGTALILGLTEDRYKLLAKAKPAHWWPNNKSQIAQQQTWSEDYGPFSAGHFISIRKMALFTLDITKPTGQVVQIGDTDNGRLFKLQPAFQPNSTNEDILDHMHLVAAIGGLLGDQTLIEQAGSENTLEATLVQSLKSNGGAMLPLPKAHPFTKIDNENSAPSPASQAQRLIIELPDATLFDGLRAISYPDFGLYIWRSQRFFMSVRCGVIGQAGNGGHAHNDQLSIELQIDGEDWLRDPGTGVYTADSKKRHRYRSHLAHFGPRLQFAEPSRLDLGLFRLEDNARAKCLVFNETEFVGRHEGYRWPTYRRIRIAGHQIEITDTESGSLTDDTSLKAKHVQSAKALRDCFGPGVAFSSGYGLPD